MDNLDMDANHQTAHKSSQHLYSFDYDMDMSAVKTLISINKVKNELPALVIKGKVYYGFKNIEEIEKIIPELAKVKAQNQKATSTKQQ
jgi:hypothetical protein